MICIDIKAGSKNLPLIFPKDLVLTMDLPSADILLTDPSGEIFWTAIEHKRVDDLLKCIVDGRFAGTQLPAMEECYDDYWLLIEGPLRRGIAGELQLEIRRDQWVDARIGNRTFDWTDLQTWLMTMQTMAGLKVMITQGRTETREWVLALHDWWSRGKEKHRSHMVTDRSRKVAELVKASLLRRVAEELPGIGIEKAIRVEEHFGDVFEMVVADENEWCRIDGISNKMAGRIVTAIRTNHED